MQVKGEILKILPKPANQINLAHIITASKVEDDISYVKRDSLTMEELGFNVEEIDIEGKNENELRSALTDKDVIYAQGGNTFYLMKCVKESGFDKVVKELIEKGVIYIGVSAGSYIACPTIEAANWKHADRNVVNLKDLTGMNLVPFLLSAHFNSEYADILKQEIATTTCPVRILDDNQAILVIDGNVKLVGRGEEIKL